jgi:hypothetical protein
MMVLKKKIIAITLLAILDPILAANFICLSGEIVDANEICNGIANCVDLSDERRELCSSMICQPQQFKCYYGGCVNRGKFCNKINDCLDGSDEFNCGTSNKSCE